MELSINKEQAGYLNAVVRAAKRYRLCSERITEDLKIAADRVSKGFTPDPIRHQDASEIALMTGQLDALESILYSVFPFPVDATSSPEAMDIAKEHETTVADYFKLAMTLPSNDYIFMKH